jgi:hypothetical protein
LRVDYGKPPVNTDTFVISTGLSLPSLNHDSHDGHDVIALDALTKPVGTLTTKGVDEATQTNLLDRWIVDPGSNTHVVFRGMERLEEDKQQFRTSFYQCWQ